MEECDLRAHLEQHHEASFGWALHCCNRNPTDAEDVLQAVYLKVLDGRARYDGRAAFRTWLFSIILRTAAAERRRHWLRKTGLLRYARLRPPETPQPPHTDSLERSRTQKLLLDALGKLPRRQQEVLHLVFYQNLSVQDAAGVLGVSVGSARQHYERGKQRMRQLLNLREDPDEER